MATVLEAPPTNAEVSDSNPVTATENQKTEKESNEEHERQMIEAAFQKIRSARTQLVNFVPIQIACYVRIGLELIDLKPRIPHGQLEKRVKDEFGYGRETVSRLRAIAEADMATQSDNLTDGQRLHLSGDLQKLAKLAQLPSKYWPEVLDDVDLSKASRADVREAIDKLLDKHGLTDDETPQEKRPVSVGRIQKTCDTFTDFAKTVTEELKKDKEGKTRSQVKKAIQDAVKTLQKLLDACEQTAS